MQIYEIYRFVVFFLYKSLRAKSLKFLFFPVRMIKKMKNKELQDANTAQYYI